MTGSAPEVRIEDAVDADASAIALIYNAVIETSTAVFSEHPVTAEDRLEWLRSRLRDGYPVIVARVDDTVVGFGSYGPFRTWPGYRFTVEHSVHVAVSHRRRGVGRALLADLLRRARDAGMHVMVAGIDADNAPSMRLHEQLGFTRSGRLDEVARKFDRWVDLVFMQLEV
jgi:L-amino acid N-acyltransferase YncA